MPEIGDEVAILGSHIICDQTGPGLGILTRGIDMRLGIVTSVQTGRDRLQQSFSFETSIPIPGGMSGAPILRKPQKGSGVIACGVASFDFSAKEAFDNMKVSGLSTAAMIWPSLSFGIEAQTEGENPRIVSLIELAQKKVIEDRSTEISVTIFHREMTELVYEDSSTNPPRRVLLSSTPDPRLTVSGEGPKL